MWQHMFSMPVMRTVRRREQDSCSRPYTLTYVGLVLPARKANNAFTLLLLLLLLLLLFTISSSSWITGLSDLYAQGRATWCS